MFFILTTNDSLLYSDIKKLGFHCYQLRSMIVVNELIRKAALKMGLFPTIK